MVDSSAEGTRQPQRGWSSLDGSCRRSMNSCAASMARMPHIRRCYRYTHTLDSSKQLCYSRLKWCWHQLKSCSQYSVHAAGIWVMFDFRCAVILQIESQLSYNQWVQISGAQEKTLYCKLCPLIHKQPLRTIESLEKQKKLHGNDKGSAKHRHFSLIVRILYKLHYSTATIPTK